MIQDDITLNADEKFALATEFDFVPELALWPVNHHAVKAGLYTSHA